MRKRYLVYMNLAGLHPKVYVCYWNKELGCYYDKKGNYSCGEVSDSRPECKRFVFKCPIEAARFLQGARALQQHLKDFLV